MTRTPARVTQAMPDPDAPLRLEDACQIYFSGRLTPATLKAEHSRGNLELSKIGRAYFTTIAKLKEMEANGHRTLDRYSRSGINPLPA